MLTLSNRSCRLVTGAIVAALTSAACANPLYGVGMKFVYKRASLPTSQICQDISYNPLSGSPKQRLDLYTPAARQKAGGVQAMQQLFEVKPGVIAPPPPMYLEINPREGKVNE